MGKSVRNKQHTAWSHPGKTMFSSEDQQEVSACLKKTGAWGHEKEAMAAANKLESPRGNPDGQWRTYKCPHCKKWHLTTKGLK